MVWKQHDQMLVILNTKKVVRDLYMNLKDLQNAGPDSVLHGTHVYHLSTDMCPKHRFKTLNKIQEHLKNQEKVLVVSTPLIVLALILLGLVGSILMIKSDGSGKPKKEYVITCILTGIALVVLIVGIFV